MILYLTSSPCIDGAPRAILNPANAFLHRLHVDLPANPRCLFIASNPEDHGGTCEFGSHMFIAFAEAGIPFGSYAVLDGENWQEAESLISRSDFIILAGGHVPTQNDFFNAIGLGKLLEDFDGVIMGISAGSMNAPTWVYAQPEECGESIDPDYRRFVPGLGLTDLMILPHYQKARHRILDGQRLYEDITYYDSYGHTFYALPDGSYFYIHDGHTQLCGEGYRIRNGIREQLTENEEFLDFDKEM